MKSFLLPPVRSSISILKYLKLSVLVITIPSSQQRWRFIITKWGIKKLARRASCCCCCWRLFVAAQRCFFPIEVTSNKRWKLHPGACGGGSLERGGGGVDTLHPLFVSDIVFGSSPETRHHQVVRKTSCRRIYLPNKPAHWSRKPPVNRKRKNKLRFQVRTEQMCRRIHSERENVGVRTSQLPMSPHRVLHSSLLSDVTFSITCST